MHFFSSIVSFAALAACITPGMSLPRNSKGHGQFADKSSPTVLSAPLVDADVILDVDVDPISVIVKRGTLSDPAQTCYNGVQQKCDDISM
jgi:hypothetical protein